MRRFSQSAESDKFAWLTPPPVAKAHDEQAAAATAAGAVAGASTGTGGSGGGAALQPRALQLIIGKVPVAIHYHPHYPILAPPR